MSARGRPPRRCTPLSPRASEDAVQETEAKEQSAEVGDAPACEADGQSAEDSDAPACEADGQSAEDGDAPACEAVGFSVVCGAVCGVSVYFTCESLHSDAWFLGRQRNGTRHMRAPRRAVLWVQWVVGRSTVDCFFVAHL